MTRKRAPRGSGSARRRADGRWEIRTSHRGQKRSHFGRTLEEAQAKARAAGDVTPRARRGALTLGDWYAMWLQEERSRLKPQTWLKYEGVGRNHIIPVLGQVQLDKLNGEDVRHLRRQILSRRPSAVALAHGAKLALSSALTAAVDHGLVPLNIVKSVRSPGVTRKPVFALSTTQVRQLLDEVRDEPDEAMWVLAATLGPRSGELRALQWEDVDLEAGRIRIVRNVSKTIEGGAPVLVTPKSATSGRTLSPLPAIVADAFSRMSGEHTGLIWPSRFGEPKHQAVIYHRLQDLTDAAKLPRITVHTLRHTAATVMLDSGVPVHVVSALLGHANVAITLSTYAHVTRHGLDAAASALDAIYPDGGSTRPTIVAI